MADRRMNLARVPGQELLDLPGQRAHGDDVVPVAGRVGGADHEHPRLAEDQQRVPPLARQRVRLDPPAIPGQGGEPTLELGNGQLKTPAKVHVAAERLERRGGQAGGGRS